MSIINEEAALAEGGVVGADEGSQGDDARKTKKICAEENNSADQSDKAPRQSSCRLNLACRPIVF